MKIVTLLGLFALVCVSSAHAQHHRSSMSNMTLVPGESKVMIDPASNQPVRVTCQGGYQPGPGPGPIPLPPTYPGPSGFQSEMEFYATDGCTTLVAFKSAHRSCEDLRLDGKVPVWSIKVKGSCIDIDDTNLLNACKRFEAISSPAATLLYATDSCTVPVAAIDSYTDCTLLPGLSSRIWSIKRPDRACEDIDDTNLLNACKRFRNP